MKRFILFFSFVFMYLNTYGQGSYIGRIHSMQSPDATDPWCSDCYVFALQTPSCAGGFLITINSQYISTADKLIFKDAEYSFEDKVIITGTLSYKQIPGKQAYFEIEIESIKKWTPNPDIQNFTGEYEIHTDGGGSFVLNVYAETDPAAAFDIKLYSLLGGDFRVSVSEDNLFDIEYWSWWPSVGIAEYFLGGGYFKNDSVFVHLERYLYNDYNESYIFQNSCEYKGKKIDRSITVGGKIARMANPWPIPHYLSDTIFGLEAIPDSYFLSVDSDGSICSGDRLIVDDAEYFMGDEVEISGTYRVWSKDAWPGMEDIWPEDCFILDIETIKKKDIEVAEAPLSSLFAVYPQGGGIVVQNVPEGEAITVYNAVGVAVATAVAGDGETFIPVPSGFLYIVKAGDKTLKIKL